MRIRGFARRPLGRLATVPQLAPAEVHAPRSPNALIGAAATASAVEGDWLGGLGPIVQLDTALAEAGIPESLRLLTGSLERLAIAQTFTLGMMAEEGISANGDGLAGDGPAGPSPSADSPRVSARHVLALLRHAYGDAPAEFSARVSSLLTGGAPLAPEHQARFGAALGHDLSHVRVHTDARAAAAATDISARAFAVGADLFFASGQFAPGTPAGDRLLAHELTHVVQHDEGRLPTGGGVSKPTDPSEREAYASESRVLGVLSQQGEPTAPTDELPFWHFDGQSDVTAEAGTSLEEGAQTGATATGAPTLRDNTRTEAPTSGTPSYTYDFRIDLADGSATATATAPAGHALSIVTREPSGEFVVTDQEFKTRVILDLYEAAGAELSEEQLRGHLAERWAYRPNERFEALSTFSWRVAPAQDGPYPSLLHLDTVREETQSGLDSGSVDGISIPSPTNEGEDDVVLQVLYEVLAGGFVENPSGAAILIRTLLGLIPGVDQGLDVEDTFAVLYKLIWEGCVDDPWVWVDLVLCVIGWIPELGSLAAGVLRLIKKGGRALPLDEIASLIRRLGLERTVDDVIQWIGGLFSSGLVELTAKVKGKATELVQEMIGKLELAAGLASAISGAARRRLDAAIEVAREVLRKLPTKIDEAIEALRTKVDELMGARRADAPDGPGTHTPQGDTPRLDISTPPIHANDAIREHWAAWPDWVRRNYMQAQEAVGSARNLVRKMSEGEYQAFQRYKRGEASLQDVFPSGTEGNKAFSLDAPYTFSDDARNMADGYERVLEVPLGGGLGQYLLQNMVPDRLGGRMPAALTGLPRCKLEQGGYTILFPRALLDQLVQYIP